MSDTTTVTTMNPHQEYPPAGPAGPLGRPPGRPTAAAPDGRRRDGRRELGADQEETLRSPSTRVALLRKAGRCEEAGALSCALAAARRRALAGERLCALASSNNPEGLLRRTWASLARPSRCTAKARCTARACLREGARAP